MFFYETSNRFMLYHGDPAPALALSAPFMASAVLPGWHFEAIPSPASSHGLKSGTRLLIYRQVTLLLEFFRACPVRSPINRPIAPREATQVNATIGPPLSGAAERLILSTTMAKGAKIPCGPGRMAFRRPMVRAKSQKTKVGGHQGEAPSDEDEPRVRFRGPAHWRKGLH
jgi:hypothetical protein